MVPSVVVLDDCDTESANIPIKIDPRIICLFMVGAVVDGDASGSDDCDAGDIVRVCNRKADLKR
jgi:hypothetical protein